MNLKKDRNCGGYPVYPNMGGMPMPIPMYPNMMQPNMCDNNMGNELSNLSNKISNLEQRVAVLENALNKNCSNNYNTNYNTSNYQMM